MASDPPRLSDPDYDALVARHDRCRHLAAAVAALAAEAAADQNHLQVFLARAALANAALHLAAEERLLARAILGQLSAPPQDLA